MIKGVSSLLAGSEFAFLIGTTFWGRVAHEFSGRRFLEYS